MDVFWEQPPITRTLTAAVFVTSVVCYTQNSFLYRSFFSWERIFFSVPPELWRLVTPFLVSGPKLGIIMDPYFCLLLSKKPGLF